MEKTPAADKYEDVLKVVATGAELHPGFERKDIT